MNKSILIELAEYARRDPSLIPNHLQHGIDKKLQRKIEELLSLRTHLLSRGMFEDEESILRDLEELRNCLNFYIDAA